MTTTKVVFPHFIAGNQTTRWNVAFLSGFGERIYKRQIISHSFVIHRESSLVNFFHRCREEERFSRNAVSKKRRGPRSSLFRLREISIGIWRRSELIELAPFPIFLFFFCLVVLFNAQHRNAWSVFLNKIFSCAISLGVALFFPRVSLEAWRILIVRDIFRFCRLANRGGEYQARRIITSLVVSVRNWRQRADLSVATANTSEYYHWYPYQMQLVA